MPDDSDSDRDDNIFDRVHNEYVRQDEQGNFIREEDEGIGAPDIPRDIFPDGPIRDTIDDMDDHNRRNDDAADD